MSKWTSCKARLVYRALIKIGWNFHSQTGSHIKLKRENEIYIWAFKDGDEIGPKMLARIAKHTALKPEDI